MSVYYLKLFSMFPPLLFRINLNLIPCHQVRPCDEFTAVPPSSFHYSHSACSKRSSLTVFSGLHTYNLLLSPRKASLVSSVWHYCSRVLALLSSSGYLGLRLNCYLSQRHTSPLSVIELRLTIPFISPCLALFKSLITFWNNFVYFLCTQ